MLTYVLANPNRVPEWRWLRSMGFLDGSQWAPTRRRDGPAGYKWIKQMVQFKRDLDACTTDMEKYDLAMLRPALFWAYNIYFEDEVSIRWNIEALILARCSDWEIGYQTGYPPKVIEAYESVFFNVRDRLQHRDNILKGVLAQAVVRGLNMREYDLLWKLYGYLCGPEVLNAVSSSFVNPTWCSSRDAVSAAIEDDTVSTMKLKAALAAKTVPINSNTQLELLHAFTKFVEVERTSDTAGKAESQVLEHIGAMMSGLPFDVGGRDPKMDRRIVRGVTERYYTSSVELTYEEQVRGAVGYSLPEADRLQDMRFPEPPAGLLQEAQ